MRYFIFSFCCLLPLLNLSAADAIKDHLGKHLDILREGKPLLRYMYDFNQENAETTHNTYKVYHHVLDPKGEQEITKGPGGNYTHHRGIFIGFARMGHDGKSYDFWHMKNQCVQVHDKVLMQEDSENSTIVSTLINWNSEPGKTLIEEVRTVSVLKGDTEAHLLCDWKSQLKAVAGDVLLKGDPEHAGVQYRPHNDVAQNKSAKYTFHADGIDPKKDKDLPWVAMTYKLGEQTYTVQHMRHPENPADSVYSAYRDYGRFGNYFVAPVADGETLTLHYRFRITLGEAPSREALQKEYDNYLKAQK